MLFVSTGKKFEVHLQGEPFGIGIGEHICARLLASRLQDVVPAPSKHCCPSLFAPGVAHVSPVPFRRCGSSACQGWRE